MSQKISQLPSVIAANIQDTDVLPLVATNITSKVTVANLRTKLGTQPPTGGRTVTDAFTYLTNNAVFNVEDFGAAPGNTAAQNTTAIQLAILKSLNISDLTQQPTKQYGTVVLKDNYPVNTLYCPRYTSIRGLTPKAGLTGSANAPILVLGRSLTENDWLDINLQDFEIHGNTAFASQHAIQGAWTGAGAYAYPLFFRNIYIRDVGGDGVQIISDNIASALIKTYWNNVQVVGAFGYAVHIKIGVFNAALFVNCAFTDSGNGFYIEDIGSGTTASEAIKFQNTQFESLGKPLGGSFTINGTFGFRSTMYTGHYVFDTCYFEGNGNKAGDTLGSNIDVRAPWMLMVKHSILVSSNNQIIMRYGGHGQVIGNYITPGANRNSIFQFDQPQPGSDYSTFQLDRNKYDAAYTDAQAFSFTNGALTTISGYREQRNYLYTAPRTKVQIYRDGLTKAVDDGAVGITTIKRLANNSGGSTTIASNGVASILKNTVSGKLLITEYGNSVIAEFLVTSGGGIVLIGQRGTLFTVTKDTATSLNVYSDAGTGTWVVQNKLAGSALLAARFEGVEPMEHADDGYYETQIA